MKKLATVFLGLIGMILVTSLVIADKPLDNGAIWTTKDDCGDEDQNVNHFASGDAVYINGRNFEPLTEYPWDITGQPGEASCDPAITVASGDWTTNEDGSFCFSAYTVQPDDCGEYKYTFAGKHDNYHVPVPIIPEFTAISAGLALLGVGLIATRKRKQK